MRFVLFICCALFALSVSFVAQAQGGSSASERADALKKEGDALMSDIRYDAALEKYQEAYKLSSNPALLYNMGRALEALSRFPEALDMLKSFDAKATPELHARVPNLQKLIDEVESRTSFLTVEAAAGATIKIGDLVLGKTPLPETRVNAGRRVRIEATAEGFEPAVKEVDLPSRGKTTVKFDLVSKDKTGVLAIDSPVKGATVTVDQMAPRQVPTEVRVSGGRHTIKLTAPGFRDNVIDVEVAIGQRRPVIIEPGDAPVYERWWFWTIIGGFVAGGVAGGVVGAYLTEGAPDEGTIPPCQVKVQAEGDCTGAASFGPRRLRRQTQRDAFDRPGFTFGPIAVLTVRF